MSTLPATLRRRRPPLGRVLAVEVGDEIKQIYREPAAIFFSVLMPVMFFALFASLFGGESGVQGLPAGTVMLARFGSYGVIVAVLMNPALGLAESRDRGWFAVQQVSPVPIPVTLAAKVIAALPFSVGIFLSMTGAAAALGVLDMTLGQWIALVLVLVVGSLPFALVGLAVGAIAAPQAATAILNAAIIPMAIAGGLWFPLEMLPGWVTTIAQALPTYHLAEIAMGALVDGAALGHWLYTIGFGALAGVVAAIAYRRAPS